MVIVCAGCGTRRAETLRVCHVCGLGIGDPPPDPAAELPEVEATPGERLPDLPDDAHPDDATRLDTGDELTVGGTPVGEDGPEIVSVPPGVVLPARPSIAELEEADAAAAGDDDGGEVAEHVDADADLETDEPFDPADTTVPGVNAHLEQADDAERRRVLDAEAAGQARKGILERWPR